jgi:hypothetical protein
MHVARDAVRQESVGEHHARGVERERAHAVPDVEDDAAPARLGDRWMHPALRGRGRVREGAEAMSEDVARPEAENFLPAASGGRHLLLLARYPTFDPARTPVLRGDCSRFRVAEQCGSRSRIGSKHW